jgi:predicted nucleotidyltransferase
MAKLRAAVASGPRLRLAVLFGSQATGEAVAGSDVDVGILPVDDRMPMGEELELASALSAVTGTEVDLLRLDHASPLLGREIAVSGICLLEENVGSFTAWRAAAMAEWIDFDEMIAPHRERFLERLARGAPRHGGRA